MRVSIIERDNKHDLENAINDCLSSSYNMKYKEIIDIKYSSYSTRFRGEYYSAMIIYKDKVV